MNRKELVDRMNEGTSLVRSFLVEEDPSSALPSSYANWSHGDVVGHIVGWMNYSIDKLSCLKLGTNMSEEYSGVSSLDEINQILYHKTRGKSREQIETDYLNSLGSYVQVVSLFPNSDLDLRTFDTGYKMELWRYMLLDTVIHPIQHLLYQYLKLSEYQRMADVVSASEGIFESYSEGKTAYGLAEFGVDSTEDQGKLRELERHFGGHRGVDAFVQANRAGSAAL